MINKITTIQELTQEAYKAGIYDICFNKKNMSRDEYFNLIEKWGDEFEKAHENYAWDGDYYDEIDNLIRTKKFELENPYNLWSVALYDMIKQQGAGYTTKIDLDRIGEINATVMEHWSGKAILVHWCLEGDFSRALLIPESEFEDLAVVSTALETFDAQS